MADATYQPKTYRKQGGDEFHVVSGGKIVLESGGIIEAEAGGLFQLADGTAAAPSLAFDGDTNTGIYWVAADKIGIACEGALAAAVEASAGAPEAAATKAVLTLGGTAIAGGSAAGTYLGWNAATAYAGDHIDIQQNSVILFKLSSVNAAVNGFGLTPTATGGTPLIAPIGSDAAIGLSIDAKSTGTVTLGGTNAAAVTLGRSGQSVTVTPQLKTGYGAGAVVADKCTAVEYGDGTIHQTVLTLTLTGANDLDLADGDHGIGVKIYDFPEGRILILGAVADIAMATTGVGAHPNDQYSVALGSVTAADDNDLTATEADIIAKITADGETTAAAHGQLAASAQFDGTSSALDLFFNVACANANNTGAQTYAATGTVTITWVNLGDY